MIKKKRPSKCSICRSKGLYPCSICPKKKNRARRLKMDKLKNQEEINSNIKTE